MFRRLLLLFTLFPLVDLALLFWIGAKTSPAVAVGLVLLSGVCGAWLIRSEGWRAWRRLQDDLRAGRLPGEALLDGLLVLVSGVLLLTPGVVTDLLALALLFAPSRRLFKRLLRARFRASVASSFHRSDFADSYSPDEQGRSSTRGVEIIDVHVLPPQADQTE